MKVAAVLLAGGLGTRLRAVLPDTPKPMASVAGRPFIEWVLRYLVRQAVKDVVIATGYRAEAFERYFTDHRISGLNALCCIAEPAPLGTAGGFLFAAERSGFCPDAWLVLNGDSVMLTDLHLLFVGSERPALLARWVEDASRFGSLDCTPDGILAGFREKRPGAAWMNAGMYLIPNGLITRMPTVRPLSWETDVFPSWIAQGEPISVIKASGPFIDIGTPSSLAEADQFIREHLGAFATCD